MAERALSDLKIVELAQGAAGPYCVKLLADLGAETIKVEPPGGDRSRRHGPFPGDVVDPEKSGQFLYLNTNKRSIVLDLARPADRDVFDRLAANADILVVDLLPRDREAIGLDLAALRAANPRLIVTLVTPFGDVGPYREYTGTAFTAYHVGGLGYGTPHNEVSDREAQPPLAPGCNLADYATGVSAAAATLVAAAYRDAYGVGQLVDVAAFETVANAIRGTIGALASNREPLPLRGRNGYPWVWPCKDGWVSLSFMRDNWWAPFKDLMGNPEWADSEVFDTTQGRQENADLIQSLVEEWLAGVTKQEFWDGTLSRDIPGFPVFSFAELLESEHFKERRAFVEVDHGHAGKFVQPGPAARYSRTPAEIYRPAPRLDEHGGEIRKELAANSPRVSVATSAPQTPASSARSPLSGIRVLDFGWILSVPHATAWLGTLGAEIIRVESMVNLDMLRITGMTAGADNIPGLNRSMGFNSLNFSKKSITLNLRSPEAIALAKELVRVCDVVTENFVVGTMERIGLDYEVLRQVKPDIIMLSGSTVGQTGPSRKATGWGPNSMAVAGVPFLTGYEGGSPSSLDATFPDYFIGTQMAQALLAALHERRRTGKGQHIDMSMAETVLATVPEPLLDYAMNRRDGERRGNRHRAMAPHGVYRCAGEDAWVAVAVTGDEQWQGLRRALGDPPPLRNTAYDNAAGRLADQASIDRVLQAWTCQRSPHQAMHSLQAEGVAAAPVLNAAQVTVDPQMAALGYMVDLDHSEVGARSVPGLPGRYSAMPALDYRPTPLLGEHNQDVFGGLLGLSGSELERLVAEKVIY